MPPVVGLLKFTAVVDVPLQTTWFATEVTVAVGLTVMVNVVEDDPLYGVNGGC